MLRREGDETTVQRRAGKPAVDNVSLVTVRFIRTSTRGSSSRPGERFSTKRPDTFTQTRCFVQPSNLLQSGGGPYIIFNHALGEDFSAAMASMRLSEMAETCLRRT